MNSTPKLRPLKTLDRVLSKSSAGSRADARSWIAAGRVKVNGEIVQNHEHWVDMARDVVTLDDKPLVAPQPLYLVLYKPKGYITTHHDPDGRPTVFELLKEFDQHLITVGRLDLDTSGLLLLTNDNQFAERIMNPDYKVPKTYQVKAAGVLTEEQLEQLRQGVQLDDGPTKPATVTRLRDKDKSTFLEITITEGRNRQVRRMLDAIGSRVRKLVRTAIGDINIDDLEIGKWRRLLPEEIDRLTGTRWLKTQQPPRPKPAADLRHLDEPPAKAKFTAPKSDRSEKRPFSPSKFTSPKGDRSEKRPFTPSKSAGPKTARPPRNFGEDRSEKRPFTPSKFAGPKTSRPPRNFGDGPANPKSDRSEKRPFTPSKFAGPKTSRPPRNFGDGPANPKSDRSEKRPFTPSKFAGPKTSRPPRNFGDGPANPKSDRSDKRPFTPSKFAGPKTSRPPRNFGDGPANPKSDRSEKRPFTPSKFAGPKTSRPPRNFGDGPANPKSDRSEKRPFTPSKFAGPKTSRPPRDFGDGPANPKAGRSEKRPFNPSNKPPRGPAKFAGPKSPRAGRRPPK